MDKRFRRCRGELKTECQVSANLILQTFDRLDSLSCSVFSGLSSSRAAKPRFAGDSRTLFWPGLLDEKAAFIFARKLNRFSQDGISI